MKFGKSQYTQGKKTRNDPMIMHGKIHMPRRLAMLMFEHIVWEYGNPPVWLCSKAPAQVEDVSRMRKKQRKRGKARARCK